MIKELRKQQKLGFFLIPSDIVFFFLYLDLIINKSIFYDHGNM